MSRSSQDPHLIVGVDFGFTGLANAGQLKPAVAWALPSKSDKVNSIRRWPPHDKPSPKVPSAVSVDEHGRPTSWGFDAIARNEGASNDSLVTLFKTWIDDAADFDSNLDSSGAGSHAGPGEAHADHGPESSGDCGQPSDGDQSQQHPGISSPQAVECLEYFLSGLYAHIRDKLEGKLPKHKSDWDSAHIWFLFSYPATWGESTTERFKHAVESTDFHSAGHRVDALYLKEAQAAMASFFAEEERLDTNHNVLVADMGGSTIDVSMFAVDNDDGRRGTLQELSTSDARYNGSARLDMKVSRRLSREIQQMLAERNSSSSTQMSPEAMARHTQAESHRLINHRDYIDVKHRFNLKPNAGTIRFAIQSINGQHAGVLTTDTNRILKTEFDSQINAVWEQLEGHLKQAKSQGRKVNFLVLTGGVSNNLYVTKQLESVAQTHGTPHVSWPDEPELAVSKGLVWDGLDTVSSDGLFTFKTKYHYGIIVGGDGDGRPKPMTILGRDRLIKLKETKTETIRFPRTNNAQVDLTLMRWLETENGISLEKVGSLTEGMDHPQKWKRSKTRRDKNRADVEIKFERRTMAVTLKGDGTTHKRVFNEKWHAGVALEGKGENPVPFSHLIAPVVGMIGIFMHLVNTIVNGDSGGGGSSDPSGPPNANGEEGNPDDGEDDEDDMGKN